MEQMQNFDKAAGTQKKRYNIGVLIGNAHSNHPKELIFGIDKAAQEEDVDVIFFLGTQSCYFYQDMLGKAQENKDYDYQFNTIYDYAKLGDVDALIISYGSLNIFLDIMDKNYFLNRFPELPYIMLEEETDDENGTFMIVDNYRGMSECIEHLITEHGLKNIVYVSGPKGNQDASERLKAYEDVMKRHGLSVTPQMIVYGNYSEFVDDKVEWLFDHNDKIDAIAFANDEMACAGYRVCQKKGLKVGRDIAITGFDDFEQAKSMDPPLTTLSQNGYDMGYTALKDIVRVCAGEKIQSRRIHAQFCVRGSCGCRSGARLPYSEDFRFGYDKMLKKAAEEITKRIMLVEGNQRVFEASHRYVKEFLLYFYQIFLVKKEDAVDYEKSRVQDLLRALLEEKFVSPGILSRELTSFMQDMLGLVRDMYDRNRVFEMIIQVQEFVSTSALMSREQDYAQFQRKTWFMNFLTRDMMEQVENEKELFANAMEKLWLMNTRSAYLYLFSVPRIHKKGEEWRCPKQMYLAACHENGRVTSYDPDERPEIDQENGFMQYVQRGNSHRLIAFTLFSGEKQYGILLTEIKPDDVAFMYVTSLQIGTILRFLEENALERRIKGQLEKSYNIIREKNEVLNFISEYDELTKLYNRRGFMEQAMAMVRQHDGERAYLVFGDLDHLKEINDTFGHSEGDFSIISGGSYLRDTLSSNAVVGRIGGDEFVAVDFKQPAEFSETYRQTVKEHAQRFNEQSKKPYYVEISVGTIAFTCSSEIDLTEMIKQADEVLYEAKKLRKKSIQRQPES